MPFTAISRLRYEIIITEALNTSEYKSVSISIGTKFFFTPLIKPLITVTFSPQARLRIRYNPPDKPTESQIAASGIQIKVVKFALYKMLSSRPTMLVIGKYPIPMFDVNGEPSADCIMVYARESIKYNTGAKKRSIKKLSPIVCKKLPIISCVPNDQRFTPCSGRKYPSTPDISVRPLCPLKFSFAESLTFLFLAAFALSFALFA